MQKRLFIYLCFMISYSGALLHSIVPHHHHASKKEAQHHHHNHHGVEHSHDHDQNKDDKKQQEPYFLNHLSNTDAVTHRTHVDKKIKINQLPVVFALSEVIASRTPHTLLVFHPPQSDQLRSQAFPSHFFLRGPPIFG